jgi:hypothetical protein
MTTSNDTATPRTDKVIADAMARHPTDHLASSSIKRALARYYEDVHQDLAPLCRELEAENRALRDAMCHPKLKPGVKAVSTPEARGAGA